MQEDYVNRSLKKLLTERSTDVTKRIALTGIALCFILSVVVFIKGPVENLVYQIIVLASMFIVVYLLLRFGYINASRILLSFFFPVILIYISIVNKIEHMTAGDVEALHYFDIRLVLLSTIVLPIVTFSLLEWRMMFVSLIPAVFVIIFFDPIHILFNAGYHQVGLLNNEYLFQVNFYFLITVLSVLAGLIFTKYNSEQNEANQFRQFVKSENILDQLVSITASNTLHDDDIKSLYEYICRSVSNVLENNRTGIWHFDHSKNKVQLILAVEGNATRTENVELKKINYPLFFKAFTQNDIFVSYEVKKDPRLSELYNLYFNPRNIESMISCPIYHNGELYGMLVCENIQSQKKWDAEDALFIKSITDLLAASYATNQVKKTSAELKELNEELMSINDNLELSVAQRRRELNEKIEQLKEYAFINSHILRAPITRISGLLNIWRPHSEQEEVDEIKTMLNGSVDDLKSIISQIRKAIKDFGEFSRNDIVSK